jgi:uncharacterized protein (TIGR03118 family)
MRLTTTFFTCALCVGFMADRARASGDDDRTRNDYEVNVLVSNQPNEASSTDAKLVNAWGISASPTSPWWVANNGTGSSTLYDGTGAKNALEVSVPGAPTGTVFNGGSQFVVATGAPSFFLFASEDGTISGWNPTVDRLNAKVVYTHAESNYKGLAIRGDRLFASDFGDDCKVVELDGAFAPVETAGGFADRTIPADFCPFGIQVIGDSIFVSYAKKSGEDDVAGRGNGYVREFNRNGHLLSRVASQGNLNSPWGMAMAPATFGRFGGCLIVGNFGDGRINAYCKTHGVFAPAGALRENNRKIVIDGLWGIGFGNGHASGPTDVLYFAAGPDEESNGAFGRIVVGSPRCEK